MAIPSRPLWISHTAGSYTPNFWEPLSHKVKIILESCPDYSGWKFCLKIICKNTVSPGFAGCALLSSQLCCHQIIIIRPYILKIRKSPSLCGQNTFNFNPSSLRTIFVWSHSWFLIESGFTAPESISYTDASELPEQHPVIYLPSRFPCFPPPLFYQCQVWHLFDNKSADTQRFLQYYLWFATG